MMRAGRGFTCRRRLSGLHARVMSCATAMAPRPAPQARKSGVQHATPDQYGDTRSQSTRQSVSMRPARTSTWRYIVWLSDTTRPASFPTRSHPLEYRKWPPISTKLTRSTSKSSATRESSCLPRPRRRYAKHGRLRLSRAEPMFQLIVGMCTRCRALQKSDGVQ